VSRLTVTQQPPKTSFTPERVAASIARSSSGGTVSRNRAPASASWAASSPAVDSGFTVVIAPPAAETP
jgi:hypothetical protein